ncbi:MAG TPA: prolyl oligopeptidase family serine peptidase [Pyrinomonadaceae bacterium]|jgi:predicted peptidase|nr:prolyl oligopeptidase family serine peptidase [Pyrinomonadaceae bacterium]
MRKICPFLLFLVALLSVCSNRNNVPANFLARSVVVDGKEYQYRVFVPIDRDPNKKPAVMLYLHGSGARGADNIAQVDGFRWAIEPVKDKIDFIVVLPQCEDDTFWAAQNMSDYALTALDRSVDEFNGDTDRIYLAGFSLGGYGVWQIAAAHPRKFAALLPVAGGVVGTYPMNPRDRDAIIPSVGDMLGSPEPYKEIAKAIGQTPAWVFHGDHDESVSVKFSRTIVKALQDNGSTNVRYTEYLGDGHQIFGKAIAEPGLFEWLASQSMQKRAGSPNAL